MTTTNSFCIEGGFWTRRPELVRKHSAEEIETLLALAAAVEEEAREEARILAEWLG